jgi:hypothetical protein
MDYSDLCFLCSLKSNNDSTKESVYCSETSACYSGNKSIQMKLVLLLLLSILLGLQFEYALSNCALARFNIYTGIAHEEATLLKSAYVALDVCSDMDWVDVKRRILEHSKNSTTTSNVYMIIEDYEVRTGAEGGSHGRGNIRYRPSFMNITHISALHSYISNCISSCQHQSREIKCVCSDLKSLYLASSFIEMQFYAESYLKWMVGFPSR